MNLAEFVINIEANKANVDVGLVRRAYEFADRAHVGQVRSSGEPYVQHCLEVAVILSELHMDSTTIAAGLLHDVVEDTEFTLEHLRTDFGDEIAELVDGVTKLGNVKFQSYEEQQVEYFRKMLLSMAKDIRVILIKLADRLHNMRTLDHLPEKKQQRIAKETREVYAPLAHRLGVNKAKIELEDLTLKYLEPTTYRELTEKVKERREEREAYIREVSGPIKEALAKDAIPATVYGRAKHLESIFRKVNVRKVPFEEIYDLFAIRVIVTTERECYHTMGIIHAMWKPVMGRFHDYIANPKPNGYRSLHTTVIGPRGRMVEIQIRTHQMHHIAENGIAAHWLYKEGRRELSEDDRQMIWLRDVLEWQKDMTNPSEFLEYLKMDLYSDDIFVYTPMGRIVHLPKGAKPLDFAFQIHTEVGLHTAGAKINGRLMPLSTELESGDTVEIMTNAQRVPSHDWLKLVKTSNARTKIRRWLKQAGFEQSVKLGRELLERKLRDLRRDWPEDDKLLEIAEKVDRKTVDDLLAALGNGSLTVPRVISFLEPVAPAPRPTGVVSRVLDRLRKTKGVRIEGVDSLMFRFANCCQPVPGDDIVGFITRGRGVTIHQSGCTNAIALAEREPDRQINVSWDAAADQAFVVHLQVIVEDRRGILRDVTEAIADSNTNVKGAEIHVRDQTGEGHFVIEVSNLSHLNRVIEKVRKVKGVIAVNRTEKRGDE